MGRLIRSLLVLGCIPLQAGAQQYASLAVDAPRGLINLDVAVTDASGNPVAGLSRQDFTVLDDGQPRGILSFHASDQSEPATQVILFIDTLGVNSTLAAQIRGEVLGFLRRDGGRLGHTVTIFHLSEEGLGRVGVPSADGNALALEVEKRREVMIQSTLHQNGNFRGVARRDNDIALNGSGLTAGTIGPKAFGQIAVEQRRKPGKKLVLWVGPGFGAGTGAYSATDLSSSDMSAEERGRLLHVVDWLSTLLRESRIVLDVFAVGGNEPLDLPLAEYTNFLEGPRSAKEATWMSLYKKVVAIQSGGRVFEPSGTQVDEMRDCLRGADIFYTLSFDPAKANRTDEYHKLTVQIGKSALTASTKTGYFDEPYFTDRADATGNAVTVQLLEQRLRDSPSKKDAAIAQELSELRLTERLDGTTFAALIASVRGDKSRQQLTLLADASAFLDPPPAEIPDDPAPDIATQRQMISRALEAVNATIPKLSNVIAKRTTIRYQESTKYAPGEFTMVTEPLHRVDASSVEVAYRQGNEVLGNGFAAPPKPKPHEASSTFDGTFGPALHTAVEILANPDHMKWKRWGKGATGHRAVFSFAFPAASLSIVFTGCCLPDGEGLSPFPPIATYRGEIEIDPDNGVLLRVELRAEPQSTVPLLRDDTLIEYGPVDIGGKHYVCPLHSISLARERSMIDFSNWDESFRTYGPYVTLLNDIGFSGYHVFRAQSRILTTVGTPP